MIKVGIKAYIIEKIQINNNRNGYIQTCSSGSCILLMADCETLTAGGGTRIFVFVFDTLLLEGREIFTLFKLDTSADDPFLAAEPTKEITRSSSLCSGCPGRMCRQTSHMSTSHFRHNITDNAAVIPGRQGRIGILCPGPLSNRMPTANRQADVCRNTTSPIRAYTGLCI